MKNLSYEEGTEVANETECSASRSECFVLDADKNDLESSHVSDSSNSPLNSSEENHCENLNDLEVNNIVEHLDNSSASSNDSSDNQIESV